MEENTIEYLKHTDDEIENHVTLAEFRMKLAEEDFKNKYGYIYDKIKNEKKIKLLFKGGANMKELLSKTHEHEEFINKFVEEVVNKFMSNVEHGKYTKDELIAYTSSIQNKINSRIGYEPVAKSVWQAKDFK